MIPGLRHLSYQKETGALKSQLVVTRDVTGPIYLFILMGWLVGASSMCQGASATQYRAPTDVRYRDTFIKNPKPNPNPQIFFTNPSVYNISRSITTLVMGPQWEWLASCSIEFHISASLQLHTLRLASRWVLCCTTFNLADHLRTILGNNGWFGDRHNTALMLPSSDLHISVSIWALASAFARL